MSVLQQQQQQISAAERDRSLTACSGMEVDGKVSSTWAVNNPVQGKIIGKFNAQFYVIIFCHIIHNFFNHCVEVHNCSHHTILWAMTNLTKNEMILISRTHNFDVWTAGYNTLKFWAHILKETKKNCIFLSLLKSQGYFYHQMQIECGHDFWMSLPLQNCTFFESILYALFFHEKKVETIVFK